MRLLFSTALDGCDDLPSGFEVPLKNKLQIYLMDGLTRAFIGSLADWLTNSRAQPLTIAFIRRHRGGNDMSDLNIGVIGAGLMGHGIGYLLAAAGHDVCIYDPSAQWRDSLSERLESARTLLGGDPALLGRISAHEQMEPAMKDVAF